MQSIFITVLLRSFPQTFIMGKENKEKKTETKKKKRKTVVGRHTHFERFYAIVNTYVKSRISHGRHAGHRVALSTSVGKTEREIFSSPRTAAEKKKNEKKKNSTAFPLVDFFFIFLLRPFLSSSTLQTIPYRGCYYAHDDVCATKRDLG